MAHTAPMLSLEKVTDDPQALRTWLDRSGITEFALEPKVDGMAMVVRYEDGHPIQMVTRGDG